MLGKAVSLQVNVYVLVEPFASSVSDLTTYTLTDFGAMFIAACRGLDGHRKTGHAWTSENRPCEVA